jgi:hemoglobin
MHPITQTVKGEEVSYTHPSKRFFEAIGGEDGMREMMYRFYDKIYESNIMNFFPQDRVEFDKIKVKNSKFFIQVCGGPKVYEETDGVGLDEFMIHVHDDFSIPEKARIEWLGCMRETLNEVDMDKDIKNDFWDYVEKFSKLTVNYFPEEKPNPYF